MNEENELEELPEETKRVLVVVYKLANGQVGRPVKEKDIEAEIVDKGIFEMTQEEFNEYHRNAVKEVKANTN